MSGQKEKNKFWPILENLYAGAAPEGQNEYIKLNKEKFIEVLSKIISLDDLVSIKIKTIELKDIIINYKKDQETLLNINSNGNTVSLRKDVLISEINQILKAKTLERAKHYLKRLKKGIQETKTSKINDINLARWKEYDEIITDSLWIFDKRDTSGVHLGWYWGNFIPQIPRQIMLRYTKNGDWVLDAFVGSGTTLIECRRLGRNGIGIELNPEVAEKARELVEKEENKYNVITEIVIGDSRTINIQAILDKHKINRFQLLIMHPPYYDIIKFSKSENDLSNARSLEEFLKMFGEVVDNTAPYLEKGRYFALVIGDKYSKGEWIPLGFYCMNEVLKRGYLLKSIIVKNFEETRGKRNQKELWRYRALAGGFYVFKHEYIMLFQKI
ncbi:TRM11 family SAM-dependent methyltransferase [Caldisericum sp.]|uniref:TRM11 family SAM-dependent methyltransferase n=1 Tax=Caldisericum sp. TaxID=2499687 RepID=UPI003D14DF7B